MCTIELDGPTHVQCIFCLYCVCTILWIDRSIHVPYVGCSMGRWVHICTRHMYYTIYTWVCINTACVPYNGWIEMYTFYTCTLPYGERSIYALYMHYTIHGQQCMGLVLHVPGVISPNRRLRRHHQSDAHDKHHPIKMSQRLHTSSPTRLFGDCLLCKSAHHV